MSAPQKQPKRYTVTAALPYANGPKHIGHLAGAYLPADVYARYLRLNGRDVVFVCGSDEHGTAIPNQALKEHTKPQVIVDKYHALIRDSLYRFGISFDVYHRTGDPLHHSTSQDFFTTLFNKGRLREQASNHYYDAEAGIFLADRYIIGSCPHCGYDHAYGDQCEQCGISLSPEELLQPCSTLTGKTPKLKPTTHWYLPLEEYEEWLRQWLLGADCHDWKRNVTGQCKAWIDAGLKPRAMTRDLDWGVPVPLPEAKGKVLYVWFDAPIGYLSATRALFRELASGQRKYATPQRDFGTVKEEDWKRYWEEETHLVHFIGKDNIVFHCIIFPVMLRAAGGYAMPANVPANAFMNLEGDKMSTSRGWSVEMHEYLEVFPGRQDALRYALLTHLPEARDSEFTWKTYQARNNNELVAILGNFVNRAMVLTHHHFEGRVPARGDLQALDKKVVNELKQFPLKIGDFIEAYRFREATAALMDMARMGNKYLTDAEPWKTVKTDPDRAATVLNTALQIVANLAVLSEPFLPFGAQKLQDMLILKPFPWSQAGSPDVLKEGHRINTAVLLYEQIDDESIDRQIQYLIDKKNKIRTPASALKPEISFEDFSKLDMRVGHVLKAECVPKSKKLLKLEVDIGMEVRTVLSGIAGSYTPEKIVGQHVVVVVNLAPRKIMGMESQGMILASEGKEGKLSLIRPSEVLPVGSLVN